MYLTFQLQQHFQYMPMLLRDLFLVQQHYCPQQISSLYPDISKILDFFRCRLSGKALLLLHSQLVVLSKPETQVLQILLHNISITIIKMLICIENVNW